MFRVLFGCLGALVIVLVLLGLGGYFFVWRPVQGLLNNFSYGAPFTLQNNQQNGGQQNGAPPAPRQEANLTKTEVQKFVRVRRSIKNAIGADFTRFENIYRDFSAGQTPSSLEVLGALQSAGGVIGRARSAQQAALAREQLSAQQYADVRAQVNRALGVPEIDFRAAAQSLRSLQVPKLDQVLPPPNGQNRALLSPFLNELRPTAALGLLGL